MPRPQRIRLSPAAYRRVATVALVLLVLIVISGAAVRLTNSGLGCTDWPQCTNTHKIDPTDFHGIIEWGNRLVTGVLSIVVVGAVLASRWRTPRRSDLEWLSWGLVVGMVGQIVVGGLVVIFNLNPYLVQLHFLLSVLLVADALVLLHRARLPDDPADRRASEVPPRVRTLARVVVVLATLVLTLGTLVTGAGPHSGWVGNGKHGKPVPRLSIPLHRAAQLHGVLVWLLVGAVLWLVVELGKTGSKRALLLAQVLLGVLCFQGVIGYTQYFTGIPVGLVELHVAGSMAVWVLVLWVLLEIEQPPPLAPAVDPAH